MCQSANTMQDEVTTTRLHASKLAHYYIKPLRLLSGKQQL